MNGGLMFYRVYGTSDMWPEVPLPCKKDLLNTLLHTKDSAPGPDGLPYSAWRLLPQVTVDAMASYFMDIMERYGAPTNASWGVDTQSQNGSGGG